MKLVMLTRALAASVVILLCPNAFPGSGEVPEGVRTAEVNGYPLAYVEKGAGPPLVLVHGIGVDYRYFSGAMDTLAAGHRVIAISLRHHFPERWNGQGEYGYPVLADDLVAFVRQLGVGPVHLLGHSHGGTVAMFAARQAPTLFRSVIVAEGMSSTSFKPAADSTADGEYRARIQALYEGGRIEEGLQTFVSWIGGTWASVPEANKQSLRDNAWTIYKMTRMERPVPFPCESLEPVKVPVLLLQGEKTAKGFSGTLDNLAPCLQQVDRATIPGATHVFPRTHPVEFSRLVSAFTSMH